MNPAPCVPIDGPMTRVQTADAHCRVWESWGPAYALWVYPEARKMGRRIFWCFFN
jgi:hypothetical protein